MTTSRHGEMSPALLARLNEVVRSIHVPFQNFGDPKLQQATYCVCPHCGHLTLTSACQMASLAEALAPFLFEWNENCRVCQSVQQRAPEVFAWVMNVIATYDMRFHAKEQTPDERAELVPSEHPEPRAEPT